MTKSVIADRLTEELLRELVALLTPALPWGQQYVVGIFPCGGTMVLRLRTDLGLMVPLEQN